MMWNKIQRLSLQPKKNISNDGRNRELAMTEKKQSSRRGRDFRVKSIVMYNSELKSIISNSRFKKKRNLVELNINSNRGPKQWKKSISSSNRFNIRAINENNDITENSAAKQQFSIYQKSSLPKRSLRPSVKARNKQNYESYFTPKQLEDFTQIEQTVLTSKNSSALPGDSLKLFKIITQMKITRYNVKELYCLHRSVLDFAKGSKCQLKKAFLIVLNMFGILVDEEKLVKVVKDITQIKKFENFITTFKSLQVHYFKQSIIDYLEILFDFPVEKELEFLEIQGALLKRMDEMQAKLISNHIQAKVKQYFGSYCNKIRVDRLYELCYNSKDLCQLLHEAFLKELHQTQGPPK